MMSRLYLWVLAMSTVSLAGLSCQPGAYASLYLYVISEVRRPYGGRQEWSGERRSCASWSRARLGHCWRSRHVLDAAISPKPINREKALSLCFFRKNGWVRVVLGDISGRQARELVRVDHEGAVGRSLPLGMMGVSAGLYIVRTETIDGSVVRKEVAVR